LSFHALSTFAPATLLTLAALTSSLPFDDEPELFDFAVAAGFDAGLFDVGFCALCAVLGSADSDVDFELAAVSSALVCALDSVSAADVSSAAVVPGSGVFVPHAVKLMRISRDASKTANNLFVISILLLNISSKSIISLRHAELYTACAF
jgi:hypothetical protein